MRNGARRPFSVLEVLKAAWPINSPPRPGSKATCEVNAVPRTSGFSTQLAQVVRGTLQGTNTVPGMWGALKQQAGPGWVSVRKSKRMLVVDCSADKLVTRRGAELPEVLQAFPLENLPRRLERLRLRNDGVIGRPRLMPLISGASTSQRRRLSARSSMVRRGYSSVTEYSRPSSGRSCQVRVTANRLNMATNCCKVNLMETSRTGIGSPSAFNCSRVSLTDSTS